MKKTVKDDVVVMERERAILVTKLRDMLEKHQDDAYIKDELIMCLKILGEDIDGGTGRIRKRRNVR